MTLPIFPLLIFLTSLGSIFLYLKTANDIFVVLAAVMSISLLIWGFVSAHWSIHLLALLTLLLLRKPKLISRVAAGLK